MKNMILIAVLLSSTLLKAQQITVPDPNAPVVTFEKDTIDYGTIPHNANGYRYFIFTNTGKSPLIINYVTTSCGCLVASWPKRLIKPGQIDTIKAHYDTHRVGVFVKTMTMVSNANPTIHLLHITGKVLPDPPESTSK